MNLHTFLKHLRIALLLSLFLIPAAARAHDMWIEPSAFRPAPGQTVTARFRVGQDFVGDPLPRNPALVKQFVMEDAGGRRPVPGRAGMDPAGVVRAESEGLMVIGYRSNPSEVEQAPEKFKQYLKEEGLTVRYEGGAGPVRELFSRCAKTLLAAGSVKPAQSDRALGFTLELVAERNPYSMHAGETLPVRLTYEGKPLAGALVVAMNKANPEEKLTARSDKDGRVRFRLPEAGVWLVKSVHMIPAAPDSRADWESFWASLTFELPVETVSAGK